MPAAGGNMATLKTLHGMSRPRPVSHSVCILLLVFLGEFAQGQGPGTTDSIVMQVEENKPVGVVVGTVHLRTGYTYSFEEPSTLFELDSYGVIRTRERIDREALPSGTLNLYIRGAQPNQPIHLIDVTIEILDVNDNNPRFEEEIMSVSFQEDAQAGQQQLIITAVDPDAKENGTIKEYSIVSGNSDGRFVLISPNIETPFLFIATKGGLDREMKDLYILNISAKDGGDVPRYGYMQIKISVIDVNDNPPSFDPSDYVTQVKERANIGVSIVRVEATDRDTGDNAQIFYFLTDSSGQFTIEEKTGVVRTLTSPLQCNRLCGYSVLDCSPYSCLLTVEARDGGRPPLGGRAYVTVNVIDENDHDPIITFDPVSADPVTGYATIDENAMAMRVASISVTDADYGVNGETSIEIINGNQLGHFRLVSVTSINYIQVVGSLDRESIAQYNLTLKALDHGTPPRSSTAHLIIIVNDANDHAPVFEKLDYRAWMSELSLPGSFVASVRAVDEDSGPNSLLTYAITAGNDYQWFAIDSATGLITTRVMLDHEVTERVVLNISARDSGATPYRNYTRLTVDIMDENDMVPKFRQPNINVSLAENLPENQDVVTVRAEDNDTGVNGTISYHLHPYTLLMFADMFQVDSSSGRVSTLKSLDYENVSRYTIKVIAQDGGSPALSATATIFLDVGDVNDNDPEFHPENYYCRVFETDPSGTQVVQVTAMDKDSGIFGKVTYAFSDTNVASFIIAASSGIISTTTVLNRNLKSSYNLRVTATDGSGRRARKDANIIIIVANVNDFAPSFPTQNIYTYSITEDFGQQASSINKVFGQVQAVARGGTITYAITSGDPMETFSIDSSGTISIKKLIDREVTAKYVLTVIATTGSKFGYQNVTITVTDLNDNSPHYVVTSSEITVMENWPVDYNIFMAVAEDSDDGINAQLVYSLYSTQDSTGVFGIDSKTGIISIKKPPKYLFSNQMVLRVTVSDSGSSQLSSSMDVIVNIQDVNDHTPVFPYAVFSISLPESKPVNEIIAKFVASDADLGKNGKLVYSILRGNEDSRFGVFPDGTFFVAHSLDRESRDMYSLTVQVRDSADVPRSSTANITIYLLDSNDNSPLFDNGSYTFRVAENLPAGTFVGKVQATDMDTGQNADLLYSLDEGNWNFTIDSVSGVIYTKRPFDREYIMDTSSVEFYSFDVFASDNGLTPLHGKASVKVFITDINDNPPSFARSQFSASVLENSEVNSNVIKMTATDLDVGVNGIVTYAIASGNQENKFKISGKSGEISVNGNLDREMKDRYWLTIVVTDSGMIQLNSSAQVIITILDTNDNAPVFTTTIRQVNVEEGRTPGELLTVFEGRDSDMGNNAKLFFSIYSGNEDGIFNLDGYTGSLYLARNLDFEIKQQYSLNISVSDAGYPPLSSNIFFTVKVNDTNDNVPQFTDGFRSLIVLEDVFNETIVTLSAEDKDSGDFGTVRFAIVSQDPLGNTFQIDPVRGLIYVRERLDREKIDYYKLVITATDQATPAALQHTTQKTLIIFIQDVNDNNPVFKSPPAYVVTAEARRGQIIAEVFADDADSGQNGNVSYSLLNQTGLFSFLSGTGQLTLQQDMPASPFRYVLRILAMDNGGSPGQKNHRSTETSITILLSSAEMGPTFTPLSYSLQLSENDQASTSVVKVSASSIRSGVSVEYYLTGITSNGVQRGEVFRVNSLSGLVTNTVQLDRELLGGVIILNVTAVEMGGSSPRTNTMQATVSLRDTNDTPPKFSPSVYSISYPENNVINDAVVRVSVSDPDTIGQQQLRLTGDGSGLFNIQPDGTVVATSRLDRETRGFYRLAVIATDEVFTSSASVSITITDINDNSPVFTQSLYSFEVFENADVGATVARVTALDADEGSNAKVTYELLSEWGTDLFQLDSILGTFTLIGTLDYELRQLYILKVAAHDGGNPSRSTTTLVYMNVLDVNDNQPVFDPASYAQQVFENVGVGFTVINVSATDIDSGRNGDVRYSLVGDSNLQFMIDPVTGTVQTATRLDRETQASYVLEVLAIDQAVKPTDRLFTTATINVDLLDINDCAPEITSPNRTSVKEETPNATVVFVVTAVDRDTGINSNVTYALAPLLDLGYPFLLDSKTGQLKVNSVLRRETIASYSLSITARDGGTPALTATQMLTITVEDVNNNPPEFESSVYQVNVKEDVSIGTSLLRVKATDEDDDVNGVVRYFIISGDETLDFVLDMASGVLRLQKRLDYERLKSYTLVIRAEDSGVEKSLSSTATVTVNVQDVNDFQPVFDDSPYIAYVLEGVTTVVNVTTVTARDEDSPANNQVFYQLRDLSTPGIFQIEFSTGRITAVTSLDRETMPMYTLTVIAQDSGIPRLTGTGTVIVFVKDVNDHAPQFDSTVPYISHVSENGGYSQSVLTVTASDLDEDANAKIMYRLFDTYGDRFAVLPNSGQIITTKPLDREQQSEYHLVVIATDQGIPMRSSSCSVIVYVDDQNDNSPIFELPFYTETILDPTNSSDFVIGVTAVDKDIGNNGKVTYALISSDNRFVINRETGVIKAGMRLSGANNYTFQVRASDAGVPSLNSTVTVTIRMQQMTGSPPVFRSDFPQNLNIAENSQLGTVVATVSAETTRSTGIRYYIAGGNVNSAFAINELNGTITVAGQIDYEVASNITLWLEARDTAPMPLSTFKSLVVIVLDQNDNVPRFDATFYEKSIMENVNLGTTVIKVQATDADSGTNGQIEFRLVTGNTNNTFQINSSSGLISTRNPVVDREGIDLYYLVIEAVDQGSPRLTSSATVKIVILDRNDNPPVFSGLFSIAVPEDLPIGSFIFTLTSSDRDTPANAIATYSLINSSESYPFSVDPQSGNVTNIQRLDAETNERYRPYVQVSDSSYQASTQLTVRLLDVNDNAPNFTNPTFSFDIREGQEPGTAIGQLLASDHDISSPNNKFYFSLKKPSTLFELDADTGDITSLKSLEYIRSGNGPSSSANVYVLEVVVTDFGMPSLSSQATITITVSDANNHAPVFRQSEYMSAVPENVALGTSILQVEANDYLDFGINAEIGYSVTGGSGVSLFRVVETSGLLIVQESLSGQSNRNYTVIVTATDKGYPPLSSSVSVTLVVTSVNVYTPVFQNSVFEKSILESAAVGTLIDTITASDRDIGLNGQVRYSLAQVINVGPFSLESLSGRLTVSGKLDYEIVSSYTLNITAKDMGFVSLSVSRIYTVRLIDVNDNDPIFNQSVYNFFIAENSPLGTTIGAVKADDADSGNNSIVNYSLNLDSLPNNLFTMSTSVGVLTVNQILDYETRSFYQLTATAFNPSDIMRKSVVSIRVYVTGVNEFFPKFQQKEYRLSVSESAMINTTLLTVQATDQDKGIDGIVYYYLTGSSNLRGFAVDAYTGVLRVVSRPDYESSPQIILTVLAKNWGTIRGNDTDTCVVNITVEDANDPPVFLQSVYTARIAEGSQGNTYVTTVSATDNDFRPENRNFQYSLTKGNEGWFRINVLNGRIETTGFGVLDRETVPEYHVTILAIDTGSPPQTGTCTVNIFLDDVNDNGPIFEPPNLTGYVTEGMPVMTYVMTLSMNTTDPDLPPNQGPYTYDFLPGPAQYFFEISGQHGRVFTKVEISREDNPRFTIPVQVKDNGVPQMTSTLTFTVVVTDVNNSPPQARPLTVQVTILDGMSSLGIIADVRPLDADLEGRYNCRIINGAVGMFAINQNCDLKLISEPANQTTYHLVIVGSDGGNFSEVEYEVKIEIKRYSKLMLQNSVAILLENIGAGEFLETKFALFTKAVQSIAGQAYLAYILSLKDSGSDLFVYLAVADDRTVMSQSTVSQRLRSSKSTLESQAEVHVKDASYQLCSVNRCQNGGNCSTRVVMSAGLISSESPYLILTSATPALNETCQCTPAYSGDLCQTAQQPCGGGFCVNGGTCLNFTCSCPPEWTGIYCADDVNECQQTPCQAGGTCRNTQGSFTCECPTGFYGQVCEIPDQCLNRPCRNGSTCESITNGFLCHCAYGYYGDTCSESSTGFNEGSYMTFAPITDYNNIIITGMFATLDRNALLLFNPVLVNGASKGYVALEILEGNPSFSFNLVGLAEERVEISLTTNNISTGRWYRIEAKKSAQMASLVVQECDDDGTQCRTCAEQNTSCYRSVPNLKPRNTSVQGVSLSVGGIGDFAAILRLDGAVKSHDFVGCAHSFSVNSRNMLDASAAINHTRLSSTCPRQQSASLCSALYCNGAGRCQDKWSSAECICQETFSGNHCEMKRQPFQFGSSAKVIFTTKESYRRDVLLHQRVSRQLQKRATVESNLLLRIRTNNKDGVIYYATSVSNTTTTDCVIWIESGSVWFNVSSMKQNSGPLVLDSDIADGQWYNITLTTSDKVFTLAVPDKNLTTSRDLGNEFDFNSVNVIFFSIGGARLLFDGRLLNGFDGCLSDIRINGLRLPLNGSSDRYTINPNNGLIGECTALCSGNPCGEGLVCTPDGELHKCAAGQVEKSAGLEPGIIVVIVFFILLLITIIIVFVIFRLRRAWFQRCLPKGDKSSSKQVGGSKLVGSENSLHSRELRYADNAHLEEMIIRNHIAEELGGQKTSSLTARPDLIGSGVPKPTHFADGTVIIENVDHPEMNRLVGLNNDEIPEHYDLENASSIAPSDSDVIQHYQRFRHNDLKPRLHNSHNQHLNHNHFPDPPGLGFRENARQRQSPVSLTGSALSAPARNSPLATASLAGRPSSALAALHHGTYGPRDSPRIRTSPLTQLNVSQTQASSSNSVRSLGSHHSHSSSSSNAQLPNGHTPGTGHIAGKRSGVFVRGLTVDEVNRLNARTDLKGTASMLEAVSSTNNERRQPHHHNHVPRLRAPDNIENNILLEAPDSSSSDSGANDSFTCSEFEYENDRGRMEPRPMMFSKLTEVDEGEDLLSSPIGHDPDGRNSPDSHGVSEDASLGPQANPLHPASGSFDFDTVLNWGPNFDKLVGVFTDIALLPDTNHTLQGVTANDYEEYV